VGWNVESADMNNRTVTLIRVERPESKPRKKARVKRKTEFFKRPLRLMRRKKPKLPSKTRIAQAQARLRNIERQRMMSQSYPNKSPAKSAYEKRLFKPEAKPSKSSN
jgi:hypothetical protein